MLDEEGRKQVANRLRRIEGQIAGIRRMVEDGQYCVDVLLQISAAQGALGQAGKRILAGHMETCVAEAFETGSEAERRKKIAELLDVFERYGRPKQV